MRSALLSNEFRWSRPARLRGGWRRPSSLRSEAQPLFIAAAAWQRAPRLAPKTAKSAPQFNRACAPCVAVSEQFPFQPRCRNAGAELLRGENQDFWCLLGWMSIRRVPNSAQLRRLNRNVVDEGGCLPAGVIMRVTTFRGT